MYKGRRFLAIIPARSGSKGLKNKNILEIDGKPLMYYTIKAAQKSNIFDYIIVSTDSMEYKEIAEKYGARCPFIRPENLANDNSSTTDVILNTLERLEALGEVFDYFVLLQPTSPLRSERDILESVEILINKKGNSVVSICELDHQTNLNITLNDNEGLDYVFNDSINQTRQNYKKIYRINGAIYISNCNYFRQNKSFYKKKSYPYIMNKRDSIDIDDEYDFKYAEYIIKSKI